MNFYSIEEVFRCICIKTEINVTRTAFIIFLGIFSSYWRLNTGLNRSYPFGNNFSIFICSVLVVITLNLWYQKVIPAESLRSNTTVWHHYRREERGGCKGMSSYLIKQKNYRKITSIMIFWLVVVLLVFFLHNFCSLRHTVLVSNQRNGSQCEYVKFC